MCSPICAISSTALWMLSLEREGFRIQSGFPQLSQGIQTCLQDSDDGKAADLFQKMTKRGFAELSGYRDKTVEQIVKENLGGIVSASRSYVIGLPPNSFEDYALVPTSQNARLAMASVMTRLDSN